MRADKERITSLNLLHMLVLMWPRIQSAGLQSTGCWVIDWKSLRVTIQPIPYSPHGPSSQSMSLQFRDNYVMQDRLKCSVQVQVDSISCTSFIHQCWKPIVEGH